MANGLKDVTLVSDVMVMKAKRTIILLVKRQESSIQSISKNYVHQGLVLLVLVRPGTALPVTQNGVFLLTILLFVITDLGLALDETVHP